MEGKSKSLATNFGNALERASYNVLVELTPGQLKIKLFTNEVFLCFSDFQEELLSLSNQKIEALSQL